MLLIRRDVVVGGAKARAWDTSPVKYGAGEAKHTLACTRELALRYVTPAPGIVKGCIIASRVMSRAVSLCCRCSGGVGTGITAGATVDSMSTIATASGGGDSGVVVCVAGGTGKYI